MSEHHESTKCANGTESKQSIKNIVNNILKQAKNTLPADRYAKFEKDVMQAHKAFLNEKKLVINLCFLNTTELKENLENKLKIQEEEIQKKEIMEAKESCRNTNFNAEYINGRKTAKYFTYLIAHPEEINELNSKFAGNLKLLAGFLHYWKIQNIAGKGGVRPESNIIHILGAQNPTVLKMDKYYNELTKSYKIDIGVNDSAQNIEDKLSHKSIFSNIANAFYKGTEYINDKIENLETEKIVNRQLGLPESNDLEKRGFSSKGLHGFSNEKGGNYFISIQDFEKTLKIETDVTNINSKALANYFQYLDSNKQLTPEILVQKFGNNTLFQLGQLWGKGGTESDPNRLIAKKILEKSKSRYIINVINTLSSPENFLGKIKTLTSSKEFGIALLFLEKDSNSLRTTFKNELKQEFIKKNPDKIKEANEIIDGLIKKLIAEKGLEGVPKMLQIIDNYNKNWHQTLNIKTTTLQAQKIQEAEQKVAIINNKIAQAENKDPTKDKELKKKQEVLINQFKELVITNKLTDKLSDTQIKILVSWEKEIDQVIEEMRKEDKEFAKEYATWEKEKEQTPQKDVTSKAEKENISPSAKGNIESIQGMNKDNPKQEIIFSGNTTADIQWVPGDRYQMTLAISGENETVTLSKKELIGYTESFQFLGEIGLGYLVKNIPPKTLSDIIKATSRNGDIIDNSDGDFNAHEKMKLLISFGEILGIDMKQGTDAETAEKVFKSALSKKDSDINIGFQKIAKDKGLISSTGEFNIQKLSTRINQRTT